MKSIIIISFILIAGFTINAQIGEGSTKYRVTAFKAGNTQINSTSNEVQAAPQLSLYIPNAFTPNNDGLNDFFGGVGEGIAEYHLTIYNRWGEKIFESTDINNKWDGRFKGEPVELGIYSYSLEAKGQLKKNFFKSGTVTVVL